MRLHVSKLFVAIGCLVGIASPAVAQMTIDGGNNYTVVLKPDGTVWGSGSNGAGQVGDGTTTDRWLPTQTSITGVTAIGAGYGHGLAVKSNGSVWVWGWNAYGQIGDGTTTNVTTPIQHGSFTNAVAVAGGERHSLVLTSTGYVYAWGQNNYGQLGDGTTTTSNTPVQVPNLSGVVAIAAGHYHSIAVKSDGTVVAWGYNGYGQLGDGTTTDRSSPTAMSNISSATAAVGGHFHTLVRLSDGTLKAVGQNNYGQLGNGNTTNQSSPVSVSSITSISKIAAGEYHSVAVKSDGTVYTWGDNTYGQIGDGTQTTRTTATTISNFGEGELVGAGRMHTLVVDVDGVVRSVGYNALGRLGDGTTIQRLTPVEISGEDYAWKAGTPYFDYGTGTFSQTISESLYTKSASATIRYTTDGSEPTESSSSVSSGGSVSITQNTTLKAKTFVSGQTPSNTAVNVYTFIPHEPQFSPSQGTYTSAQNVGFWSNTSGVVYRYTTDGSTPNETSTQYTGAISIGTTTVLKAISTKTGWTTSSVSSATYTMNFGTLAAPTITPAAGTFTSSAELTMEAAVGAAIYYTTDGSTPTQSSFLYTSPITVTANATVKAKAFRVDYTASSVTTQAYTINLPAPSFSPTAGSYTASQAITISTTATGSTIRYTTTGVDPTESSASIASGGTLIVGNYTLKAKVFKSGNGASSVTSAAYTATTELGERLAAGSAHSLAVQADGGGWAWGRNSFGQLGDGTNTNQSAPVEIIGSTGIVSIAGGKEQHSLAARSDGAVFAWGANGNGQLGVGSTYSGSNTPQLISGLSSVVAVAAGGRHSVALKNDGTIAAWGSNDNGQVGDGTTTQRTSPVAVSGLTGITAVAAGNDFSIALKGDGTVWAWGYNSNGELGDGTTTQRNTPVQVSGISSAIAIAAGANHAIAILSNGTAKSWGWGSQGQLGNGSNGSSSTPVTMSGVSSGIAAAAGTFHSLVLSSNGSVRAFGYNYSGQLGTGNTTDSWGGTTPVGLPAVVQVAAGANHSLAMTSDGTVWAWGDNTYGQIGDRTTTMRTQPVAISTGDLTWSLPAPLFNTQSGLFYDTFNVTITSPDTSATIRYTTNGADPTSSSSTVASGGTVSVAQTLTLKASAWLSGSPTSFVTSATYTLKAVAPALSPASGTYGSAQSVTMSTTTSGASIRYTTDGSEPTESSTLYSSAITASSPQTVKATAFKTGWTKSDSGASSYWVSAGTVTAPSFTPSAGTYTSAQLIAISTSTSGASIRYTIDGTTPTLASPLYVYPFQIDSSTTVKAVAFKNGYTESSTTSGSYALDLSGVTATPTLSVGGGIFPTLRTVTVTGESGSTLRYTTDGSTPDESDTTITSGNSLTIDQSLVLKVRAWKTGLDPSAVRRADYVITGAIIASNSHSLALKADRTLWGWGQDGSHQLGDCTSSSESTPVQVMTAVSAVAASNELSVAVKSDGTVWRWGSAFCSPTQVTATGFTNIVAVAVGANHALGLKSDGTVWAWGTNSSGQLGDGTTTTRSSPVQVLGVSGVTAIAAFGDTSYAIASSGASSGSVWGWGLNDSGQIGDGSFIDRKNPVIVGTLASVTALSAGYKWAMALKSDGTVWAWGINTYKQLGYSSSSPSSVPVQVQPLAQVAQIAAGYGHALAVARDGRLWAWGDNASGQLGYINVYPNAAVVVPQLVGGASAPVAIAAGLNHSLLIKADGAVQAWGQPTCPAGQVETPTTCSSLSVATNTFLTSDSDGDSLTAWREYLQGSDPLSFDTNGNGIGDGVEFEHAAADPENPDTDGDGVSNWAEVQAGTDPFDTDSDDDSVNDSADAFPLDPSRSSPPSGNPSDTTPPTITLTEPTNATLVP